MSARTERLPVTRILWAIAGTVLLAIGIAGVILPMLPGTVFLLGASACYVRGSDRLHRWLITHRILGYHLRVMKGEEPMPLRAKITAIGAMWIAVTLSLTRTDILLLQITLAALAVIGTWFILARR